MPVAVARTEGLAHLFLYGAIAIADLEHAAVRLDDVACDTPGLARFVDASLVTAIDMEFDALRQFAVRRSRSHLGHDLRIAILAEADLTFLYARVYQALRRRPTVRVEVFRRGADALAWLASEA
jgi:hypothetical protein